MSDRHRAVGAKRPRGDFNYKNYALLAQCNALILNSLPDTFVQQPQRKTVLIGLRLYEDQRNPDEEMLPDVEIQPEQILFEHEQQQRPVSSERYWEPRALRQL